MSKKISSSINPKDVAQSTTFVEKAEAPFSNTPRLTADERKRLPKARRGASEVIPTIAQVATKYGIVPPGVSLDEMLSNVEEARTLEPLLRAAGTLYETVRDSYLRAQSSAWKSATLTYVMLATAGRTNQAVLDDLAVAVRFFKAGRKAAPKGQQAAAPAAPATKEVGS